MLLGAVRIRVPWHNIWKDWHPTPGGENLGGLAAGPSQVTQVRSLLGLCGFYQRFVTDYATVAAPLTDLIPTNIEMEWLASKQHAIDTLNVRLLQAPVFVHPDHLKPYTLHTNASDVGAVATLSQLDAEGLPRLVACRSRNLNSATE